MPAVKTDRPNWELMLDLLTLNRYNHLHVALAQRCTIATLANQTLERAAGGSVKFVGARQRGVHEQLAKGDRTGRSTFG